MSRPTEPVAEGDSKFRRGDGHMASGGVADGGRGGAGGARRRRRRPQRRPQPRIAGLFAGAPRGEPDAAVIGWGLAAVAGLIWRSAAGNCASGAGATMGCCSGNKVGDAKASTDGPDHPMKLGRRGCTDCLCLILFVIFWAGMAFIAYLGVTFGDANALVYGQDYMANRCGVGAYADRPKVYYPRIDEDMIAQSSSCRAGSCGASSCTGSASPSARRSARRSSASTTRRAASSRTGTAEQGQGGRGGLVRHAADARRAQPLHSDEALRRTVAPSAACGRVRQRHQHVDDVRSEFPNTWLVAEALFYKQGECEVKMSMMTTVVLQDTSTSVLTEQIAEHMTAVSRVAESLWESRWYILAFASASHRDGDDLVRRAPPARPPPARARRPRARARAPPASPPARPPADRRPPSAG